MSFNRSGYIGRAPGDSAITIARKTYEPTGVQTDFAFSAGYVNGYCDVYLNGVKLVNEKDYTATNGSTVGLTSAANNGDIVEVVAYKAFNLGVPLSDITGDLSITGSVSASSSITADNGLYGDGSNLTGVASTDYIITGTAATFNSQVKVLNLNVTGITSTTSFNVGTATTIDGGGINVTGVITATTFSGDGTNITGIVGVGTLNVRTESLTVSGVSTLTGVTNVTGAANFASAVNVDATTDSTSATSGALIVDGGLGVAKNVYIGAGLSVAGTLTYEDVTNVDSVGLITAKSGVNVSGGQVTIGTGITMGIAGVSTFSGTADIHMTDGVRLNVGDSSDFSVYHDGSGSYLQANSGGTGSLYLDANGDRGIYIRSGDGSSSVHQAVSCVSNAEVQIYYDNSKKFETTNDGTKTTGIGTFTGNVDINHGAGQAHYQISQASGNTVKFGIVSGSDIELSGTSNNSMLFKTNNSERLRILGSGLVGINTSVPTALLSFGVKRSTQTMPPISFQADAGAALADAAISTTDDSGGVDIMIGSNVYMGQNGTFTRYKAEYGSAAVRCQYTGITRFYNKSGNNAPEESMRINGDGRLLIGLTTSRSANSAEGSFQIEGTGAEDSDMSIVRNQASSGGPAIVFGKSRGADLNDNTLVQFGDQLGTLVFVGADGTDLTSQAARIDAHCDDTPGSNDMPGRLTFSTTENGQTSTTERLRIDSRGDFIFSNGALLEKVEITAGKLSANQDIDLKDGMVHYFTTQETTTSTPNIRVSSAVTLNDIMTAGDVITVTLVTTAAAAGYSANMTIDGNAITEEWVGGSAPSAGGSDGLDVYVYTIICIHASNTGDSGFKVIANYINATN